MEGWGGGAMEMTEEAIEGVDLGCGSKLQCKKTFLTIFILDVLLQLWCGLRRGEGILYDMESVLFTNRL